VRRNFIERCPIDQGANVRRRFQPVSYSQFPHAFDNGIREVLLDAFVHVHAISAHTGLPAGAKFIRNQVSSCFVDVRVFENDKRCISAQLQ
jgi:hypothetical protein